MRLAVLTLAHVEGQVRAVKVAFGIFAAALTQVMCF